MEDIVLLSGVRTAIGTMNGSFSQTPASDLGAAVIRDSVERAGLEPEQIDQVILGCVGQVAEDGYIARVATLKAGLPIGTPAYTVNRICGSGLESINTAARWLQTGDAEIIVAGGAENMTMQPYLLRRGRSGYRLGHDAVEDNLLHLISDPYESCHMGITAENLAEQFEVSRETQDEVSVRSQERALAAIEAGYFKEQILPIEVRQGRDTVAFDTDEHPRRTDMERLGRLRPAFKPDGQVTAGNSSGINDGAGAVVVTTASKAAELGLTPKFRLVARAQAGVEPRIMGSGPIPAMQSALEKAGLTVDDMDTIELNEAFASVAAACSAALDLPEEKTNPNGGAIALGHPVGASGTILTVKAMYELERIDGQYAMVSLCIGGGQGIASIFERIN
ncbi:MAG: thiolase family protein [Chloroflexota bacterium]|nr:thiolase family protein [Chloroflexota bacterium]MDE2696878.1 thiolase family protein [Chloroflexota bacterium]MXZ47213.1 thiolase family protein [Chloroflexota bacterium]MXZ63357.1 thiolase family protein [Chloroflexota bacterium]MYE32140.1 thiolase family protein [Chloroflexota bacterium]